MKSLSGLASRAAAHFACATVALTAACAPSTEGTATTARSATPSAAAAPTPHTAPAPAPPPPSDQQSAEQAVTAINDAYDAQNWVAYTALMCTAMRAQYTGVVMDSLKKTRIQNGPTTIKSMTIAIDGDTATATINAVSEGLGAGTISIPLKREGGWKVCKLG